MAESEVSSHLSRTCGSCALAFLLGLIILVVLDVAGVGKGFIAFAVLTLPLALSAAVGIVSSTSDCSQFQRAGNQIPAVFAGMAAGAEWASAALLLGAPASLLLAGFSGRPLLIGLTGGYVLIGVLIGPFLRNCGAGTLAHFMAARYGGSVASLAVVVLLACSAMFMLALIEAAVPLAARALAVNSEVALYVVISVPLLCALPGGMAGVTATQVAQYTVLLVGGAAAFFIYFANTSDASIGASHDALTRAIEAAVRGLGLVPAPSPQSIPFHFGQTLNDLGLIVCLMTGTASLPHVLMHPLMTRGMGEARTSAVWSLFFIALLVLTLPTYMTLSSSVELQEQGGILAGLVPAIAVTSMLAAMSALLLTIANCLEHDIYGRVFPRQKSSKWRPMVVRVFLLLVTATALYAAGRNTFEPASLLAWAFSLAAAGFFPALVLGIWWSHTTAAGAVCGIISSLGLCCFYLATNADAAAGVFGIAVGFLVTAGISLLGEKPSKQKQAFLDAMRAPLSKPVLWNRR